MKISISIIIPVYNVEKYLADCLDSVVNQIIPFDEIIVVNDGSTDKSGKICFYYKVKNPEIILIEQENAGLSEARNVGLKKATGDYIVFLDSDDKVSPDMCKVLKETIEKNVELDVVYYASEIIKDIPIAISDDEYSRNNEIADNILNGFDSLKILFPAYYQMSACMAAYRKNFLNDCDIMFIKGILYEDRFFSLRVITEAEKVIYITYKLYIRRFRADSIVTSSGSKRKIEDVIFGHKAEWDYIKENEKWQNNKKITQYYILSGSFMALQNDVGAYNYEEERKTYIISFLNQWISYFDIYIMSINELTFLMYVLDEAENNSQILPLLNGFDSESDFKRYVNVVKKLLVEKCKDKLEALPLQQNMCIGVYGLGKHTECMLKLYNTYVGEIKSELYFIVSKEINPKQYGGNEIRVVDHLCRNTDYIIISSKMYQTEMCRKLDLVKFDRDKVITLYGANDAVDFVIISKLLLKNINC